MMDSLSYDQKTILEVKAKLWKAFDALRLEDNVEDYYLVLFLLSLYKDNVLKIDSSDEENLSLEDIENALLESDVKEDYKKIYEFFQPTLQTLSSNALTSITQTICDLDHSIVSNNFPELFDSVLYDLTKSQGKMGGESIQPLEITRLINRLSQLPKDANVYNPFAGLASFATNIQNKQYYFGQEINPKTWAIGALRLMAYKKTTYAKYERNDSISGWPGKSHKFDLIVSNPPFAFRIGNHYGKALSEAQTTELFLIEQSVQSLKSDGKLIAVLPVGFLFKGGKAEQLRKRLVDEDILDTIISLPGGLLYNTGIPVIILIVNKKKDHPGKVRLIKADAFVESKDRRTKILNDRRLAAFILNGDHSFTEEQPDFENSVSEPTAEYQLAGVKEYDINKLNIERTLEINEIKEINYNLNVPRYFQEEIPLENNEKLVKLKDILEPLNEENKSIPEKGSLLDFNDLKDDRIDFRITISDLKNAALDKAGLSKIEASCLLMAARSQKLKPTYFEYEGMPIYTNRDILAFKLKSSEVDSSYLIHELFSDYVNNQLNALRIGTTIPTISKEDLLNVSIKLPSLEEQRAKVKGIYEVANEIRLLQAKLESITVKESEVKYEKDASLKHRLGGPLLNLGSSVRNIERVLDQKFDSWGEIKLSDRHEITLKDTFKSIYQTLNMVHQILANNEDEINFSNKKLDELDTVAYLKNYVKRAKAAEASNVTTRLVIHPDITSELDSQAIVLGNPELLDIALNTIVENAEKHAFTDGSKKYVLEFRVGLHDASDKKQNAKDALSEHNKFIKIEVANNGKAFPDNFSLDKLIMKNRFAGETGNTGQGGFDLNEIIKFHNKGESTLDLIKGESPSEFSTTYSFLIPLNR